MKKHSIKFLRWISFFLGVSLLLLARQGRLEAQAGVEMALGKVVVSPQQNGSIALTFKGILQSSAGIKGPWSDVLLAASPYPADTLEANQFYRARHPESIFASSSVLSFSVRGPLQQHFELAFAGLPDGIFPPVREKPYFAGELRMGGTPIPVSLRVRGNSSLQECPFPKLKFKVSRDERVGTPFFDVREVKIGTHCAEGGRGNIGRLREQLATFREALAYEAMDLLGFLSPRVRRVHVHYEDTTPAELSEQGGWQVSRDAFVLEDIEVVAEGMGGRALSDEELAMVDRSEFDPQLLVELQFFHALLGNWDYGLFIGETGLWNVDVIELASGDLLLVAGDFDLASWVTGIPRFLGPRDYRPEIPDLERQALYELEQIQQRVETDAFSLAANHFISKRSDLEEHIRQAEVDEVGRENCLRHLTAFYDALGVLAR